jgi:hypothetical protein
MNPHSQVGWDHSMVHRDPSQKLEEVSYWMKRASGLANLAAKS